MASEELPLFLGLNDKSITAIPKTADKLRCMVSVAPMAANPGRWVEQPRMPIPTGEHAVVECNGRIHCIAGYAKHRVDQSFHQVFDPKTGAWQLKAPYPAACNHVAAAALDGKIYTFGGFIEQNRCPHSKCFVYDAASDEWAPIAGLSRPRGAISAVALDGKIHLLGGEATARVFGVNEAYDPKTDSWEALAPMAVPRHGLHGATCAVIGNRVHVPGGGPIPGGAVQGAYHDAFTFG
jgi:N-acetylneuraminic acid mutarotase